MGMPVWKWSLTEDGHTWLGMVFCKCSLKMGMPGWVWWPDWSQVFLAGDSGPTEVRWYTWLAGDGGPTEVRCSWLGMVAWLKSGVPGWGWWPDWSQVFLAGYGGLTSQVFLAGDGGLTEVRCSWLGIVARLKSGVPGWGWWPDWSQVFLAGYGGLTEDECAWLGVVFTYDPIAV